jgi:hypothetical protein
MNRFWFFFFSSLSVVYYSVDLSSFFCVQQNQKSEALMYYSYSSMFAFEVGMKIRVKGGLILFPRTFEFLDSTLALIHIIVRNSILLALHYSTQFCFTFSQQQVFRNLES